MPNKVTNIKEKHRIAEFLQNLQDYTVHVLQQHKLNITDEVANKIARDITDLTRKNWGGSNIYFPKNDFGQLSARDQVIYNKFRGDNILELVREFNVSEQYIYRIIKYKRAEDIASRQREIF